MEELFCVRYYTGFVEGKNPRLINMVFAQNGAHNLKWNAYLPEKLF